MGCILNNSQISCQCLKSEVILIELTHICNLRCIHCFNESGNDNFRMTFMELEEISKYFLDKGIKKIVLSGGELFCLKDAKEIMSLFKKYEKVQVLTNGTLLTDDIIQNIIDNQINLQVTLNGHNNTIDAVIRGAGAFEQTSKNIIRIIEKGGNELINISCTLHNMNIEFIEDFILYCKKKLKVKAVQFAFVGRVGRALEIWDRLKISYTKKVEAINKLVELQKKYQNEIQISFSGMTQFIQDMNVRGDREISCNDYTQELQINADSSAETCPKFSKYLNCIESKGIHWKDMYEYNFNIDIDKHQKCETCDGQGGCIIKCSRIVKK